MHYVYILQSIQNPEKYYTGLTNDLERRLKEHNKGLSTHTNKFKPWKIKTYVFFDDIQKATKFEAYLKSGNGRIFARQHL
jgi:predicted GIY-YIG superfamily endonuclease